MTKTSTHDSTGSRRVGSWSGDTAACWWATGRRCRAGWSWWWGRSPRTRSPSAVAGWTGSSGRLAEPWLRSLEGGAGSSLYTATNLCTQGETQRVSVAVGWLLDFGDVCKHRRRDLPRWVLLQAAFTRSFGQHYRPGRTEERRFRQGNQREIWKRPQSIWVGHPFECLITPDKQQVMGTSTIIFLQVGPADDATRFYSLKPLPMCFYYLGTALRL